MKTSVSSEYTRLEYLKINKKCFFLLKEFQSNPYDLSAEITAILDDNMGSQPYYFIYGSMADNDSLQLQSRLPAINQLRYIVGDDVYGFPVDRINMKNKICIQLKRRAGNLIDLNVLGENNEVIWAETKTSDNMNSTKKYFRIFGSADSTSLFSGKLYGFKASQNNEALHDLIPVMRNSDKELGLLDLVDGTFYENQGSGIIERGEELA